jgi:hypothetical protein
MRKRKIGEYGLAFERELTFVTTEWSEVGMSQDVSFKMLVSFEAMSAVMAVN